MIEPASAKTGFKTTFKTGWETSPASPRRGRPVAKRREGVALGVRVDLAAPPSLPHAEKEAREGEIYDALPSPARRPERSVSIGRHQPHRSPRILAAVL